MKELISEDVVAWLTARKPQWTEIAVDNLHRLPMGASRETFRFDLSYADAQQGAQAMKVILRRDPPASNVDSDRAHEFAAYQAIYGHGVPVPKMILLEEDAGWFDGAVSLAEDLRGFHNSEYQFQDPAWADKLPHVAREMWTAMGKLAAVPVEDLDLSFTRPATREKHRAAGAGLLGRIA
ncbi:hypothetical protein ACFSTD_12515 [Novosphingobium colocasiae]